MSKTNKIKVFIIDDSVMARKLFSHTIDSQKDMKVVGIASNQTMAQLKISKIDIDVIVTDVVLSNMDGLYAIALVKKDNILVKEFIKNSSHDLIKAIHKAYKSTINNKSVTKTIIQSSRSIQSSNVSNKLIAIGASTGGVKIIEQILRQLPINTPPILIVQHISGDFVSSMASRIDCVCHINVKEAQNGEELRQGTAYISPGDIHMKIKSLGKGYKIVLEDGDKVNHHKPSIDILFNSVAYEVNGLNSMVFLLTGMGNDGALGMKAVKQNNGRTYVQSEESCTVYGMPKEALKLNAVDESLSPNEMISIISGNSI